MTERIDAKRIKVRDEAVRDDFIQLFATVSVAPAYQPWGDVQNRFDRVLSAVPNWQTDYLHPNRLQS
jgi:hypothetical protein